MYRWKTVISVFASASFAVAFVFAAQVSAQEGAWGGDVEDFSAPRPAAELKPEEAGEGDPDFGAALEAASAAETKAEHVPKNEITVVKNTDSAAVAPKAEKKKKEKAAKAGSGEKLNHTMGGRLGIGSEIELGLGLGIGITDVNRLELGINMGLGLVHGNDIDGYGLFEAYVLYEWRFNISEELSWFAGAGGAVGYHNAWWKNEKKAKVEGDTATITIKESTGSSTPFGISVGGRVGIEVDLSFIDPDHALRSLRSSTVSLDVRPMLCVLAERYPGFVMTVGINYNYVFGGGKGKDAKDKEKK